MRFLKQQWRILAIAFALAGANLALGAGLLRGADQQPGEDCCKTCICWCAKASDIPEMGVCSSLGRGTACGAGNTDDGQPKSCPKN